MQVLKFGGSSLADYDCLQRVRELILTQGNHEALVVLSAPGGVTDKLVELCDLARQGQSFSDQWQALTARLNGLKVQVEAEFGDVTHWPDFTVLADKLAGVKLLKQCPDAVQAYVISFGERVSVALMVAMLSKHKAHYLDATACIATNDAYLDAEALLDDSRERFTAQLQAQPAQFYIMPGFTGSNSAGELTTLGRNGSDYSAAIAAACIQANVCQIWTDVDGVYSADPRLIKKATKVNRLSYKEAMELSYFGAKVLHPKTILLVPKQVCHVK